MLDFTKLTQQVKDKEIAGVELSQPYRGMTKLRFFISTDGVLCVFGKGRSRRGSYLREEMLENFKRWLAPTKEQNVDTWRWNNIRKYRKMAAQAQFTNSFIQDCLKLPETREQWETDGKKRLYDYGITTGNRIDGKVISLASIEKRFPWHVKPFRQAVAEKTKYHSMRFIFRGYDCTLETWLNNDGELMATMALEFRNCGNGYYYILINEDNFIGYDID